MPFSDVLSKLRPSGDSKSSIVHTSLGQTQTITRSNASKEIMDGITCNLWGQRKAVCPRGDEYMRLDQDVGVRNQLFDLYTVLTVLARTEVAMIPAVVDCTKKTRYAALRRCCTHNCLKRMQEKVLCKRTAAREVFYEKRIRRIFLKQLL